MQQIASTSIRRALLSSGNRPPQSASSKPFYDHNIYRNTTKALAGLLRSLAFRPLSTIVCTGHSDPVKSLKLHRAWSVAAVAFVALVGAAGFRSTPGVMMVPLQDEFGWSRATTSLAVSVNLILFGLTAPFAAALMDRFGIRRVTAGALLLISAGSGLTVFMNASWQLVLCWGVLVGLGTGSMAMVFGATIANRWFVKHRGVVLGVLTAGGATGQLAFLPLLAWLVKAHGWRSASLTVAACALAVVPLVVLVMRERPADVGLPPYGALEPEPPAAPATGAARTA
jgi:MFS family permease